MKSLFLSKQWIADLDAMIASTDSLQNLQGKSVLITGATGLIGSALIDLFIRFNETHEEKIRIIAAGRNMAGIQSRFAGFFTRKYFLAVSYNASDEKLIISEKADYIVHCASNAYPSIIVREPVETMQSNFTGTLALLKYARDCMAEKLLFVSSSEVYGKKEGMEAFSEEEYGWIDLLNPRNSYSVGKRAAETLCVSFAEEFGLKTVIVRPGHIYGPTASKKDNRVSSMWAFNAAEGQDLIMKSDGAQLRSYCHCLDCASAMVCVLVNGENRKAYNISNPNSIISIREMAELIAKSSGVNLVRENANDAEKSSFNPMSNSSLNSDKLQELGWKGIFDAKIGFAHTVTVLQEILAEGRHA